MQPLSNELIASQDPGRPCLVGMADPVRPFIPLTCERCDKRNVFVSTWQARKVGEIMRTHEPVIVTLGGKPRPPIALFCWECSRALNIKGRAVAMPKEALRNV